MLDGGLIIKPMIIENYSEVYEMWNSITGVRVSGADSKEAIATYLERNPNLSFVCYDEHKIVGTILCGHDGRRGFIHHTCVLTEYKGKGIGKKLVKKALEALSQEGIDKSHLFVICDNENGKAFWRKMGFQERSDILIYSKNH